MKNRIIVWICIIAAILMVVTSTNMSLKKKLKLSNQLHAKSLLRRNRDVCPHNYFQCNTARNCIPNLWRCDSVNDCADGSDEQCEGFTRECPENILKCDGYKCIRSIHICDGINQCDDGTDESNCTTTYNEDETRIEVPFGIPVYPSTINDTITITECQAHEFRCDSGTCISGSYFCDRDDDCGDLSDERNCTQIACRSDQFTCDSGYCIDKDFVCDNDDDCQDMSDERNCTPSSTNATSDCLSGFRCIDSYMCLPSGQVCDGQTDCLDQSDEMNCNNTSSEQKCKDENKFSCGESSIILCIPFAWVCDGDRDCLSGVDEQYCGGENVTSSTTTTTTQSTTTSNSSSISPCSTGPRKFECDNGECIYDNYKCDGDMDCSDNSDENNCADEEKVYVFHFNTNTTTSTTTQSSSTSSPCSSDLFQCDNGDCIFDDFRCDGDYDCLDNSDEVNCTGAVTSTTSEVPITACTDDQFRCDNGQCIIKIFKCDHDDDCSDGSDERDCAGRNEVICGSSEYKCPDAVGCIPLSFVCDTEEDCIGGEDEKNCTGLVSSSTTTTYSTSTTPIPSMCDPESEFYCKSDDKCIPIMFKCNRKKDCSDFSDEIDCGDRSCTFDEFRCTSTRYCVFQSWVCDRQNDCIDNSDEFNCTTTECKYNQFTCPDGLCLDRASVCDTLFDCYDGSDEANCSSVSIPIPSTPSPCTSKEFRCISDSSCLPIRSRCNDVADCPDLSDEENCEKNACLLTEFSCLKSGTCLPVQWLCDGYEDCLDGSDETAYTCSENRHGITTSPIPPNIPDKCNPSFCSGCSGYGLSTTRYDKCPHNFEKIGDRCLWVNVFPRKWLMAEYLCEQQGGRLTLVDIHILQQYLLDNYLSGWNYWVGAPTTDEVVPTREVHVPTWFSNGRSCADSSMYPAHSADCFYINYGTGELSKAPNCNDLAGFICEAL